MREKSSNDEAVLVSRPEKRKASSDGRQEQARKKRRLSHPSLSQDVVVSEKTKKNKKNKKKTKKKSDRSRKK